MFGRCVFPDLSKAFDTIAHDNPFIMVYVAMHWPGSGVTLVNAASLQLLMEFHPKHK